MTAAPRDSEAALLAPLLELTVLVAQAGYRAVPRIEPPPLLRPYVGFTRKVPKPALRAARRVLDDDEAFRARLAPAATEDVVGEAGYLYANRPPGWEERLAELAASEHDEAASASAAREERALQRRLAAAGEALERTEATLAKLRVELDTTRSQLAEERRLRSIARDEAALLHVDLAAALEANRQDRSALAGLRSANEALTVENETLRERLAELEGELDVRGELDQAVGAAVDAVHHVHAALLLLRADATTPAPMAGASGATGGLRVPARTRRDRAARRAPLPLPGGVHDDSAAAAAHLLGVRDVRVLVDGYNVAKTRWPDLAPAELRERLVAAVAPLAARTGARFHLVFDGDGDRATSAVHRGARVRVSFTQKGFEADDAILELLAKEPIVVPVVVVSNDRRVLDGARAAGAATLSSDAFIAGWGRAGV